MNFILLFKSLPALLQLFQMAVSVAQTVIPAGKDSGVTKLSAATGAIVNALPAIGAEASEIAQIVPHVQSAVQHVVDDFKKNMGEVPTHPDTALTLDTVTAIATNTLQQLVTHAPEAGDSSNQAG